MAINKNQTTKELLKLVEYQIEQIFNEIQALKEDNKSAHDDVKGDLRFIKNNLFDPKEGVWAEVKQNSNFRNETVKWRNALGLGFFGLIAIVNYYLSGTMGYNNLKQEIELAKELPTYEVKETSDGLLLKQKVTYLEKEIEKLEEKVSDLENKVYKR